MREPEIKGIVAYPVTPFLPSGDPDLKALGELIERLIADGVHAIAPLGSTGESAYLSDAEWDRVAEASLVAVDHRVPTIVGIGDLTTASAVRRAKVAERHGADAVMLLPVSYWPLSERELTTHFGAVSEAVSVPIMAYNNPATSGIDMSPELLVSFSRRFENVTMIKESSGDITRMQKIAQLTEGQLPVFNGSNPLALQAFAAGAKGWCTAAPCLIPGKCLALYEAMRADDLTAARSTLGSILPLLEFILAGGLPTTVKAGLAILDRKVGDPRAPLLPLDQAGRETLAALLRDAV